MEERTAPREEDVVSIVARVVGALAPEPAAATVGQSLIQDLGYDSFSLMELSFALEDIFQLEAMSVEETIMVDTVRDVAMYVHGKLLAGGGTFPEQADIEERLAAQ